MSMLIAIITNFLIVMTSTKVNDTTMLVMAIIFAGGLAGYKS